jgi:ParB-like chromosome segregation protein Spo0J
MTSATATKPRKRFELLTYEEVDLERVHPNPDNPRPKWHLKPDDPQVRALADSMASEGQARPATVYEIVGHYKLPDQPHHYMLVQGHRRLLAARLAGLTVLQCLIVRVPESAAIEREWLAQEDTHHQDWGLFFKLRHAHLLAAEHHKPVVHADIMAKTGLKAGQLEVADKLFRLEDPIIALVAESEQQAYEQEIGRRRRTRLSGSGVRVEVFTPQLAAKVWDLYVALRENVPKIVADLDAIDVQERIAIAVTAPNATHDTVDNLISLVKAIGAGQAQQGAASAVHALIANPGHTTVTEVVRTTRFSQAHRLEQTRKKAQSFITGAKQLLVSTRDAEDLGANYDQLRDLHTHLLQVLRWAGELERKVERRIADLETERKTR